MKCFGIRILSYCCSDLFKCLDFLKKKYNSERASQMSKVGIYSYSTFDYVSVLFFTFAKWEPTIYLSPEGEGCVASTPKGSFRELIKECAETLYASPITTFSLFTPISPLPETPPRGDCKDVPLEESRLLSMVTGTTAKQHTLVEAAV